MQSLSWRRPLRLLSIAFLIASAAVTFVSGPRLWSAATLGALPLWVPLLAPIAFTLFIAILTVDRLFLARGRGRFLLRTMIQLSFAAAFLALLWPQQLRAYRHAQDNAPQDVAEQLLHHRDPRVRAVSCELLGLRGQAGAVAYVSELATSDASLRVRAACAAALAPGSP
jgi:hypothetical protein